jgi:pyruvate dehydrogenase E2 component (dihydrolipoamide acetyltransferase)
MSTFKLPDLGEGLHEAEIVSWHVSPGDRVVADQPLVSVETAKALVEIPSPESGRIARLHGDTGDMIDVGSPLVEFGDNGSTDSSETVVGELPHDRPGISATTATAPKASAAPAVRHLAHELSVDLAEVHGSGANSRITIDDVRKAAQGGKHGAHGRVEPLRGPRRSMARTMVKAGREVVPATVTADADVTVWQGRGDPLVRLVQAVSHACSVEPALNAWYDGDREEHILHEHVNLGFAMDTPEGLFVPVLSDAGKLAGEEIRNQLDRLKSQVSNRQIAVSDLTGQTITLSNFGTLTGRYASLVVVPPQVAIVGAGRIGEQVVAINGKPTVRSMVPLSLTFDHRAVTGGEAARFLAAVVESLEAEGELQP